MPYVHGLSREPYPVGAKLTSGDPEPIGGHTVRDDVGRTWYRMCDYEGSANWHLNGSDQFSGDMETWTHVAGNFGPVTVIESADDDDVQYARKWLT